MSGGRDSDGSGGLEWALIAPGKIVVATPERAWLHRPDGFGDTTFSLPMQGPGSPATTRNLLDAAVGAGQRAGAAPRTPREQTPREQAPREQTERDASEERPGPPPMTLHRWVWRLAGYYRTTHATPLLMTEAARRFAARGFGVLAGWAEQKAKEERGHDELALRDIRALGYDAAAVVEALAPSTSVALVRYFTESVYKEDPIGCVGYSYALERLALTRGRGYIEHIESVLPKGVDATRCLRVHSGVGSDARHVEETVLAASGLPAAMRAQIALATYETTALCYLASAEEFIAEDALKNVLASCAREAALTPGECQ